MTLSTVIHKVCWQGTLWLDDATHDAIMSELGKDIAVKL